MTRSRDVATQGGLVLVNQASINATTTLSINNCFTSAYKDYRILITGYGVSNSQTFDAKLRASGTDLSSDYDGGVTGTDVTNAGVTTLYKRASTTSLCLGYMVNSSSRLANFQFDLFGPQQNTYKSASGLFMTANGGLYNYGGFIGNWINNTNRYDGISFISSGNWTGTIKVYGYKD
jgi:hypothetical protein